MNSSWDPPHEVKFDGVDEILKGAFDIHVHSAPDMRPRLMDVVELVQNYRESGFSGAVLKDHFLPTVGRSFVINKEVSDFHCFPACVLNSSVGGLNPAAVEVAIAEGASMIFMPTSTSAHHLRIFGRDDETEKMLSAGNNGITILDALGNIKKEVYEILDILAKNDVTLASGHLSVEETQQLMKLAKKRGVKRRIVTHASIDFIDMPIEIQKELAEDGTYIEHCYVSCVLQKPVSLEKIAKQILQVDTSKVILSSDFGQPNNPAPSMGMKYFMAGLLALGIKENTLRKMVVDNPKRLLLAD